MRNLAVFGVPLLASADPNALGTVRIDGVPVRCALVETPDPAFDRDAPENRRHVLVRVKGFSCNYRDKGFVHMLRHFPPSRFFALGSEFTGTVIATGAEVETVRVGDRVIGDNHYTGGLRFDGHREGVVSNRCSREYQVLHEAKVLRIPERMPDEAAAGFSLNAQTAYSMIRKAAPRPGDRVLVTSARSNVSLFVLAGLKHRGVEVHATTTSVAFARRIEAFGATVIPLKREPGAFEASDELRAAADSVGGFDQVFDPLADLHLGHVVHLMAPYGHYVTCGFAGQNPHSAAAVPVRQPALLSVMETCIARNLTLSGNCIGLSEDLRHALDDYRSGRLEVVVDSVFGEEREVRFLDRSFNDPERFGKVVYMYRN